VVDACLIPEIRLNLDKLCDFVKAIMERKDYCVVCVAEGEAGRGRTTLP
jgi:6-phosphofructokinase